MQLISLADLQRPDEELGPLISQAQKLGELWLDFIRQDADAYEYNVFDGGEKNRSPGIHASEMSKCMVKMVYSIAGVERRVDPASVDANMKLRFRTGTAIHAMVQRDFERMAQWYTQRYFNQGLVLTFEKELSIKPHLQAVAAAWGLSSHCDGAFTFQRWNGYDWQTYLRVGVEIKTTSDAQYVERKKPDHDHMEQTCLYQACLDLPLMWVLYYNKSNSNFTTPFAPWLFKFDRHLWERELEVRFAKAHQAAATGQMPERSEGRHCSWCPFSYACKPNILTRMSYTATPVISSGLLVRR